MRERPHNGGDYDGIDKGGAVPVEIRIPTVFRKFTDQQSTVEVDPGPISALIGQLEQRYPGFGKQLLTDEGQLHRFVNVYVNDEDIRYLEKLVINY